MNAPVLLSTKKLTLAQKELLLNAGFRLVEYDAISIEFLKFEIPKGISNAIFTSQNGVRAYLENSPKDSKIPACFCVGNKTASLLEENGHKVIKTAQNSAELANFIAKSGQNERFFYFCGINRRDELPSLLKAKKIELFEVKTYKTELKPKKIGQKVDGILFFSPSGVQSFMMKNSMQDAIAFCIGETSSKETKKYTNNVVVANSPTIESVIAKAAKTFQTQNN